MNTMTCRSSASFVSTCRKPVDLRRVHRLDRVVEHQEPERALRGVARGMKIANASACSSPWLITPNASVSDCRRRRPSTHAAGGLLPTSRMAPSSTLLSCRSAAQIRLPGRPAAAIR